MTKDNQSVPSSKRQLKKSTEVIDKLITFSLIFIFGGIVGALIVGVILSPAITDYYVIHPPSTRIIEENYKTAIVDIYVSNMKEKDVHIYDLSCRLLMKDVPRLKELYEHNRTDGELYISTLDNLRWLQENGHCKNLKINVENNLKNLNFRIRN